MCKTMGERIQVARLHFKPSIRVQQLHHLRSFSAASADFSGRKFDLCECLGGAGGTVRGVGGPVATKLSDAWALPTDRGICE